MNIHQISEVLQSESLRTLILQSYDVRERQLIVAFTCDGGPRENDAYLVQFENATQFHMPSVLYTPVTFKIPSLQEQKALVPPGSFDEEEIGEGGYTVVTVTSQEGAGLGFYVVADSVSAKWVPREECLDVW